MDTSTSKRKRSQSRSVSRSRSRSRSRSPIRSPSPQRDGDGDEDSPIPSTSKPRKDSPPRRSDDNATKELIPISSSTVPNGKRNGVPPPPERTEESGAKLRAELNKLAPTRAGGAYIPPARLRALMAEAAATDPGSLEYQRMSWDALKKSLTGLINKVALENIKHIVPELFGGANLIRGRGLFCRSIMRAQSLSLSYTPVLASLTAIINTKLPMVGELLVIRLISQFRRSFRRNDKTVCHSTSLFLAHLVNQRVVTEVLALEILVLLLEKPSDDSIEIAVGFMREVGAFLSEESPKATNSIFDRFRAVLYEGSITKRVQYMIEVLTTVRRDKFKDNPRIPEELDLVEEDDQITHKIGLDDELNVQEGLNIFKADPSYLDNEDSYRQIKREILGENSDTESGSGSESGSDADSESSDDEDDEAKEQERLDIQDRTETNMVNLRRTIYLTIMSAAVFEEAVHKLLKLDIPEGKEIELCNMVIECCSQERTYAKFYGHIGERLCKLRRMWSGCFEECFKNYYDTIHRYETNRLRNIARFFGTLLGTDSISWASFEMIHMNEDDTTSSSRIFVKILFQEINELLGMKELKSRFEEESMQESYKNIFPMDNPKNTRFSINYFTSIQLGALTEGMREHLKNAPKLLLEQQRLKALERANQAGSSDSSSSDSSSDSDSSSVLSSSSDDDSSSSGGSRHRDRSRSRTPPRNRRRRSSTYSRSRSPAPASRRKRYSPTPSPSRSPVGRRRRSPSDSRSRSPPRRRRRSPSDSRSPPPRRRRSLSYDSRSPPPKRRRSLTPSPPRRSNRGDRTRDWSPPPPPKRADGRDAPPHRR